MFWHPLMDGKWAGGGSYLKNEISFYFAAYCTRNPVPFFPEDICSERRRRKKGNK